MRTLLATRFNSKDTLFDVSAQNLLFCDDDSHSSSNCDGINVQSAVLGFINCVLVRSLHFLDDRGNCILVIHFSTAMLVPAFDSPFHVRSYRRLLFEFSLDFYSVNALPWFTVIKFCVGISEVRLATRLVGSMPAG
jgi:hypothetical protein